MEKNLHASIPASLVAEAQQAASADHISVDELVREAVEHRLQARRRQNL
jgi:predicted HicB family RNase H-like nuclease